MQVYKYIYMYVFVCMCVQVALEIMGYHSNEPEADFDQLCVEDVPATVPDIDRCGKGAQEELVVIGDGDAK